MNEANQNDNFFDADALFSHPSDRLEQQREAREFASESSIIDHNSCLEHYPDQGATQGDNNSDGEERELWIGNG
jgi:hypothetical protein